MKKKVTLIPETMILGPMIVSKTQKERWIERGWVRDKEEFIHVDKVFPRNSEGKCYILKEWLLAPLRRIVRDQNLNKEILNFDLLEDNIAVNYAIIPELPLLGTRCINDKYKTLETFEYIDSTFTIPLTIKGKKETIDALKIAGMKYGLFSRTKKGYGKFKIVSR